MAKKTTRGGISIELEHIFPIIKKWLYSEKEIFIREIVSNACDAITKLRRLISLGQAKDINLENARINVILDNKLSTITVTDTGIGMTKEELEKYICQIALSGALDFIQKYEGSESDSQNNGIIGHFGLGFYSSFMVSDKVEIITKSYTGSKCVKWTCTDDGDYEIEEDYVDKDNLIGDFGTAVIMHINDEGKEFMSSYKLKDILHKYCAFMPEEIYFIDVEEDSKKASEDDKKDENEPKKSEPINDTHPLWLKNPSDCTEEEYKDFYRKVFNDWKDPLFHIHIKADYPLNFKGILYFPRIGSEFDRLEGQVKLYYNQVFVADNIKEVIPEYLLLLKGVLDCPELPLNVSRSYLQNSGYVSKISAHITKKVADKLNSMFSQDRSNYESIWKDLKAFVEYGCMRDNKFYERVKDIILLEQTDGTFKTIKEYLDSAKETNDKKIYYTTDPEAQSKYIQMYKDAGINIAVLDKIIDTQFINVIEQENNDIHFARIDAEVADVLKADGEVNEITAVADLFKKVVNDKLKVTFDRLKDATVPAILNVSEETRRMNDMMKMYKMDGLPTEENLIVNLSSPLVDKMNGLLESEPEKAETLARQIYMLASIAQRPLTAEELVKYLEDNYKILEML